MNRNYVRTKFFQRLAIGVSTTVICIGLLIAVRQHNNSYRSLLENGKHVLRRVSLTTKQSMWELNYSRVKELIHSEMGNKNIAAISILDNDKNPVAFVTTQKELVSENKVAIKAFTVLIAPIVYEKEPIGTVKIYLSSDEIHRQLVGVYCLIGLIAAGIVLFLTTLLRIGQQLIESRQSADEANKAKSEFLAKMSHEIRTPMNGVIGMTHIAYDETTDKGMREYLSAIRSSAETLLTIINDILDFSKVEAGRLVLDPIEFSLTKMLDETISLIEAASKKREIEIVHVLYNTPGNLIGDEHRLRQIFLNILGNAIKFTPVRGGVLFQGWPEIQNGDEVTYHFAVSDTGVGISPEQVDRIFEPFKQADATTTRKFGGTGLGLAISKQLLELMGGKIWVRSIVNVGSTFHFTVNFKIPTQTSTDIAVTNGAESSSKVENTIGPLSILIAEDNVVNQKVISTMLRKYGHNVIVVDNGSLAVNALKEHHFDFVFMDLQMPVLDGLDATKLIRGLGGEFTNLPIVALTADVMTETKDAIFKSGMNGVVLKPFKPQDLINEIKRLIAV